MGNTFKLVDGEAMGFDGEAMSFDVGAMNVFVSRTEF